LKIHLKGKIIKISVFLCENMEKVSRKMLKIFRNRIRKMDDLKSSFVDFDRTGFINGNHANEALQRMDQFLRNKQLCDVTLIGTKIRN